MSCCALAGVGCKPIDVAPSIPAAPAIPILPAPGGLFAAPPAPSTQGVLVDPFAFDPNAPLTTGVTALGVGPPGTSQMHVPVANRDWTWEQIVDAFDDYFRIERERQVQLVGDVLTEGRIDSYPLIGATILEPHRRDSVGRYNRWESTFQTIRRRATLRVIPDAAGYIIDVTVEKDLENLPRPENATAGAATFANSVSVADPPGTLGSRTSLTGNWIFIGRDSELEREILANIQSRLNPQAVAPAPMQ